jgi:transposase
MHSIRPSASVEDVNYQSPRGLDRALFLKLAACDWIAERRNLLVTGASGLGKSWLACALGHKACRENMSVLYTRIPRLFADLAIAHGDPRYARLLRSIARVKLLILDGVDGLSSAASWCHGVLAGAPQRGRPSVKKFIRIGVDLAKNYFQVHALISETGPAVTRKLTRAKMREFFAQIEPCRVGMEACGSAHYWARELRLMGHEALLMPPTYTKPYVKRGKNDAVDAEAICEAVSRPTMRFVPVKSEEQQAILMLHTTRELVIKQRTMTVNALRSHLSEFGIVVAKGIGRIDELLELAATDAALPEAAKAAVKVLASTLEEFNKSLASLEKEIACAHAKNEMSCLLVEAPGIGKLIATAIVSSVPDPGVFESGRDFAAWLGLTPRQNSSGGKQTLGAITKRGNRYIRKLLVLAATSLLNVVGKREGRLRDWIVALLAKKPARLVTVALANKLARIIWAMMKTGEGFRTELFAKV